MFVTHFSSLVRYLKMHPKVTLIQLQSEISGISKSMRFLYQARSGVVEIEDYGMRLAEMSKLPQELLDTSWRVLGDIKRTNGQGIESSGLRTNLNRRKLILQVRTVIIENIIFYIYQFCYYNYFAFYSFRLMKK